MKIVIIDGQGGRMGKSIIEQLHSLYPELELYGIGSNSIATCLKQEQPTDLPGRTLLLLMSRMQIL